MQIMTLKDYQSLNKLTDESFAALIGITRSQFQKYKRRKSFPTAARMLKIWEITNGKVEPNDHFPELDEAPHE